MRLINDDSLVAMDNLISVGVKVNMILCDLPYGTTAALWDSVIPMNELWSRYDKLITDYGCIALFGSEPFSSLLRISKLEWYKYDWIWEKSRPTGFLHAKNKPLKAHENISIFSKGTTVHESQSDSRMIYNPQRESGIPYVRFREAPNTGGLNHEASKSNEEYAGVPHLRDGDKYPRSVLKFSMHNVGNIHPTQKPVELLKYLILTYTSPGYVVMDNCMGSGSTGIAATMTGRDFIGIESDTYYFDKAKAWIETGEVISSHVQKRKKKPMFNFERITDE